MTVLFKIRGVWSGLCWGCAFAGRPSVQLNLHDSVDIEESDTEAIHIEFMELMDLVSPTVSQLQLIQIHASEFTSKGKIHRIGDPLYQDKIMPFITHLLEYIDIRVVLMLNNHTDISLLDPRTSIVLAPSSPSSLNHEQNYWANLGHLSDEGEILFRIRTAEDFEWMQLCIKRWNLTDRFTVHMLSFDEFERSKKWAEKLIKNSLGVHFLPQIPFAAVPLESKTRRQPN